MIVEMGHGDPLEPYDLADAAPLLLDEDQVVAEPTPPTRRFPVAATVVLAASAAWLGAMLWFVRDDLRMLAPVALVELIAALAVVPMLIGILWLLVMRTSHAEARRFADVAASMRREAADLDRTATGVGTALAGHRRDLADQVSRLSALGDAANQRLGDIGRGMAAEVADVDDHVRRLSGATADAQAQVDVLLASLPRARDETEAVADLLDQTGLAAGEHAAALDAQLRALAERGREADAVAGGAANRLAAHLQRMEATSETAGARLETVTAAMSAAVDALLDRTADAVDEARKGIAAQGEAMLAIVGANQAALDRAARENADALATRIGHVEAAIDRLAERLAEQRGVGDDFAASVESGINRAERRLDTLHTQGIDRAQMLAASIAALGSSAEGMTDALRAGDGVATRTIATTESLLIALDAATREIDESLPEALNRLDARIARSKTVVVQAKPELLALVTAAESTHDAIEAIAGVVGDQRRTLEQLAATLDDTLTTGRTKADALGRMVDEAIDRSNSFADEAAPRLMEALLRVRETAATAAEDARHTLSEVIPAAADQLHDASATAMRRAASDTVRRQIDAIGEAGERVVAATTQMTERLSVQVDDLLAQASQVEARMAQEREARDVAARDTLSARVTPLIEALHSASIDLAKAFAPDVTDTAWAAYLKGDRGVFTRRAVRIIDGATARDIARLYDEHDDFREVVNRYIHDFEAMLRAVLPERDGSPLAVTLLSSDMGKLYVALAQAIERLR